MILQLNPPLPLDTPKGLGWAHFVIDPSQDHHLQWVVFIKATGQCWTFENPNARLQENPTMGIRCRHADQFAGSQGRGYTADHPFLPGKYPRYCGQANCGLSEEAHPPK